MIEPEDEAQQVRWAPHIAGKAQSAAGNTGLLHGRGKAFIGKTGLGCRHLVASGDLGAEMVESPEGTSTTSRFRSSAPAAKGSLGLTRAKGRHSGIYEYFLCWKRSKGEGRDLPYIDAGMVEDQVVGRHDLMQPQRRAATWRRSPLVPQHDDFDRRFSGVTREESNWLEDSDEREVEERRGHGPDSSLVRFDESPDEPPGRHSRHPHATDGRSGERSLQKVFQDADLSRVTLGLDLIMN